MLENLNFFVRESIVLLGVENFRSPGDSSGDNPKPGYFRIDLRGVIRQQWGVVRHGTPPLKTEKSNNPPPKKSGGGGRYPPPTGSEKLGPPWRAERAENFFCFFM